MQKSKKIFKQNYYFVIIIINLTYFSKYRPIDMLPNIADSNQNSIVKDAAKNIGPSQYNAPIERLPSDALNLIFLNLNPADMAGLKVVCRRFYHIVNSEAFCKLAAIKFRLPVEGLEGPARVAATKIILTAIGIGIYQPGDSVTTLTKLLKARSDFILSNIYRIDHSEKKIIIDSNLLKIHLNPTEYLEKLKREIGNHPYLKELEGMSLNIYRSPTHWKYPKFQLMKQVVPEILAKCPSGSWTRYSQLDMPNAVFFHQETISRNPGAANQEYVIQFHNPQDSTSLTNLKASL